MFSVMTWLQAATAGADMRTIIEISTIVFFGGASWQQLRDLKQRVARIESKIFNGGTK